MELEEILFQDYNLSSSILFFKIHIVVYHQEFFLMICNLTN